MDRKTVKSFLERIKGVKVLVAGDLMVDEFLYGKVSRISPEAPIPVLEFSSHVFLPGGAANTAVNITSLGGKAVLVGCVGQDAAGENLSIALSDKEVEGDKIVTDAQRRTTLKTRVIAHTQQVVRIDREDTDPIGGQIEDEIMKNFDLSVNDCQSILVSDYVKGVITPSVLGKMIHLSNQRKISLIVDTKINQETMKNIPKGIDYLKPNILEAERLSGIKIFNKETLKQAGEQILSVYKLKGVVITRAEQGMSVFEKDKEPVHIEALSTEVHDVTGAGDTVGAALALGIGAGLTLEESAILANLAAAVVVRKVGTTQANPDEIAKLVEEGE